MFFVFLCFFLLTNRIKCHDLLALKINNVEKQLESVTKKIQVLEKENYKLRIKLDSYSEYCKLLPDDVCGPCKCKDDDRLINRYYCDCQNLQAKRDCREFYQFGVKVNGIYKAHQNILKIIQVYCDQATDGGGWAVIQRRVDGSVDFFRDWKNYKKGFGPLQNEFWLGLDNIFTISLQGVYPRSNELRIDMKNLKGVYQHVKYKEFEIANENRQYLLHVGKYSGTATDELKINNGQRFTTFDNDNDVHSTANCGDAYKSGWWFKNCFTGNLNGIYHSGGKVTVAASGMHWGAKTPFSDYYENSLLFTEMKVRRNL